MISSPAGDSAASLKLIFAHSAETGMLLFYGALIVLIILGFLFLVVAARRGLGWLLVVFFLPISRLVLIFLEREAMRIFLWELAVMAIGFLGLYGIETKDGSLSKKFDIVMQREGARDEGPSAAKTAPVENEASLKVRQERLQQWKRCLEAKQAALTPHNPVQRAAFDRDLKAYLVELEKMKAEIAAKK